MKNSRTLIIAALVLVMAVSALAQPGSRGRSGKEGRQGDRQAGMMAKLDLTEDQQTAINALRDKNRDGMMETRKEIARVKNDIKGLMLQDDPDAKAVDKLVHRSGELQTAMRADRMAMRLEMRKLLTDEQRDRLITMQSRGGHHGSKGDGPRQQRR